MNTPKDDGGPAFPAATCGEWQIGMSLRDWFAGQALCGFASSISGAGADNLAEGVVAGGIITRASYALADAMIAARNQP